MGKQENQNLTRLQAKREELKKLLVLCQAQVNELSLQMNTNLEEPRAGDTELTTTEKLLDAATAIMDTVNGDLRAWQEQMSAALRQRPTGTFEVAEVKQQIAVLEATRERLDTSIAKTRQNFETVDSIIEGHLHTARSRLAALMRGGTMTSM